MRLTCPNCGAEYEIADAMVPAAGRHVQCTACHTRWFVRGQEREAPGATALGEEQILRRLESKAPHLRAVPQPAEAELPPGPPRPSPSPAPRAVPSKPAERPMSRAEPTAPRAQRLDLGAEAAPLPAPEPAGPSRFGRGLLVALVVFALALAGYVWRAPLAAQVPAVAPALSAYGRFVDDLRLDVDRQVDDFNDWLRQD